MLPSADSVNKLIAARRFAEAEQLNLALEQRALEQAVTGTQLRLSFDRARSVWPGHYSGLASDSAGRFHALWADRRSGYQQMYSAHIDVSTQPEPPLPPLRDTVVSQFVRVMVGQSRFNEAKGMSMVELQLRNESDHTIYGPLRVRISRVISGAPGNAELIEDASNGRRTAGALWDYSALLGSRGRLEPGMVSEARWVTIRNRPDAGLDVVLEFEVLGRVQR